MLHRLVFVSAFFACLLVLTSCGSHSATRVAIAPPSTTVPKMTTTSTTIDREALGKWLAGVKRAELGAWLRGLQPRVSASGSHVEIGTAISLSIQDVMACIRAHESGDYNEHSHLGDGSGAYQMIPGTWRYWSNAAGYPGYAYAYEAPAAVQDAVTAYTLTHGGAGNWSPAYGNDNCTAGLR